MITVLLMNYRRAENLPGIIAALKRQTIPCEIFLWNNSGTPFQHKDLDWVIDSSMNVRCWSRWTMVPFARYEYIMTHDDDMIITDDNALEGLLEDYKANDRPGLAMGTHGVLMGKDQDYYPSKTKVYLRKAGVGGITRHYKYPKDNMSVDVVKGRLIMTRKSYMQRVPMMPPGPDTYPSCDDIVVNAYLAQGAAKHHLLSNKLNGKLEDIEDKETSVGLSDSSDWKKIRNEIANYHFNGQANR